MRYVGFLAAALVFLGCGPDPNAKLPQIESSGTGGVPGSGGTDAGGSGGSSTDGTGGVPGTGGSSVTNPFGGRSGTGGRVSSGGASGSTARGTGGRTGRGTGGTIREGGVTGSRTGGRVGTGGITPARGGSSGGGVTGRGGSTGGGGSSTASTAACADATPISGSVTFNTTSTFCFVTCDNTTNGWGCDSFTDKDRTVTVNSTKVTCGGTMPAKKEGGYYYFEIGPGGNTWDAIHFSGPPVASCPKPAGGFSP